MLNGRVGTPYTEKDNARIGTSGHSNLANGRPILAFDVWTCTPKREAPPKRSDAERIYLRTFRLPADSLPLSETTS